MPISKITERAVIGELKGIELAILRMLQGSKPEADSIARAFGNLYAVIKRITQ